MVLKRWATTRDGIAEEGGVVTAPRDGQYLLNGVPFRMFRGAALPPGAVIVPTEAERTAAKAAPEPENKAAPAPAVKRSKKATE